MNNTDEKQSILIADDNPINLKMLSDNFSSYGYEIRVAMDGKATLDSALALPPDLILLDIHMPIMDGYEACRILKKNPKTQDIPIIFVSALDEQFNKVKGFELGAVDYITKPIQLEEAKSRIEIHLLLKKKIQELEKFNRIMVDREMRIIVLKKEVNKLSKQLKKEAPYPEIWEADT